MARHLEHNRFTPSLTRPLTQPPVANPAGVRCSEMVKIVDVGAKRLPASIRQMQKGEPGGLRSEQ